jgi:TetR/AcrR family transcriptional regulator, lmrAB and yxaGH operons repressor
MARTIAERSDALPALADVFREYGYDGASLSVISERTGLGKGSLYNFFPNGKEEMAAAVLDEISAWFENHVFSPLQDTDDARQGIARMFDGVEAYFMTGQRTCLVGGLAIGNVRDRFADRIQSYFSRWMDALTSALQRSGMRKKEARQTAEDVVAGIQGGIILARALHDQEVFKRTLARLKSRCGLD